MNAVISPNSNVVHEAEAQRQYARLKLPAKIRYRPPQARNWTSSCSTCRWAVSASSQAIRCSARASVFTASWMFEVEGIGFAMDVQFQVRSLVDGKCAGCEFHELRPREIAALRHWISSFLSGELVNVGDLISTLQRDTLTRRARARVTTR